MLPSSVRATLRRLAVRSAAPRHGLPAGSAAVALTFDDGPDARYTPEVLEQLDGAGATATFFLVGEAAQSLPGVVAEIVAAGHTVGSHTWSHPGPGQLGARALLEDCRRGREVLEDLTGRHVRLFRPTEGHIDVRVAAAMRGAGLRPWLWTDDPEDWRPGTTEDALVARLAGLRAGAVVLLHDGLRGRVAPGAQDRSATVAAVPRLCAMIRSRGLALASLPRH
jgi:peptidoglycan-N-acetylglucosamine deacetylase